MATAKVQRVTVHPITETSNNSFFGCLKFAWGFDAEIASSPSFFLSLFHCFTTSLFHLPLSGDDVNDDWRADEWGDGIQRNDAALTLQVADKVAHQGNY